MKRTQNEDGFFNKISLSNSSPWRHLKPLSGVRSTSLHVPFWFLEPHSETESFDFGWVPFILSSSGSIKGTTIRQLLSLFTGVSSISLASGRWDDMTVFLPAFEAHSDRFESCHLPRLPRTYSQRNGTIYLRIPHFDGMCSEYTIAYVAAQTTFRFFASIHQTHIKGMCRSRRELVAQRRRESKFALSLFPHVLFDGSRTTAVVAIVSMSKGGKSTLNREIITSWWSTKTYSVSREN